MPRHNTPDIPCPDCWQDDPQARSRHQLQLVQTQSLEYLEQHIEEFGGGRDAADAIGHWVRTLMAQWGGLPDGDTGRTLPWWQAREQFAAAQGLRRYVPLPITPLPFITPRAPVVEEPAWLPEWPADGTPLRMDTLEHPHPDDSED